MPTCQNCHQKWTWKQTIKKTMTLMPGMSCPWCGEIQYQSKKSRKKAPFLSLIVLLPLLLNLFFDMPSAILLSLIPLLAIIVFIIYPFFIDLSSTEEFPF